MESGLPVDSPPPVTDLSPALDEVEEIEEIEHLEDVEVPLPPADTVSTETPASLRILPAATAKPVAEEPVPTIEEPLPAPPPSRSCRRGTCGAEHAVEESHPRRPRR